MKKLLLTSFLVLIYALGYAQSGTLTGKVTDTSGKPVGFASIALKGTPGECDDYSFLYILAIICLFWKT